MARRIHWQIVIAVSSIVLIVGLLGHLALSTANEGPPTLGGTYTEALIGEVRHLNPLRIASSTQPEADLSGLLFEGLTRAAPDGRPLPALAEDWEQSEDGRVYTFTLQLGVTWHNGQSLRPADVVFTYRMLADAGITGDPALQAFWRNVLVDAVDDRRVRFRLAAPFSPFLNYTTVGILPAHLLENKSPEEWAAFEQQPVGTGPYRLVSLSESEAVLELYSEYYAPLPPYLKRLVFRFYPSLDAAHAALGRREAQGLGYNVTEQGELPLPPRHERWRAPLAGYTLLSFNLREAPLDSLKLRQALALGLDKDRLIEQALGGLALRLDTPILNSSWAAAPGLVWYRPDLSEARRLLAADGWQLGSDGLLRKAGAPLRLALLITPTPDRMKAAQEVQRQWRELGVLVELEQVPADELRRRLGSHEFSVALHGWARLGSDPDIYELWHSTQVDAGNVSGLIDEDLDRLLASARRIENLDDRTQLYRQALKRWIDLVPSIMLYQPLYEELVASEVQPVGLAEVGAAELGNVPVLYSAEDRFRFLTGWSLSDSREVRTDLRNLPERSLPR